MSDTLRDRIATVLRATGVPWDNAALYMADAVIAELGWEREHWQYGDGHTMGVRYRYVTEWEKEDE